MRAILPEDKLLTSEEALAILFRERPLKFDVQEIHISDALNKISAENIYSDIDLPPFSRSTVDGFAIRSQYSPGKFKKIGKINIGEYSTLKIEENETVEVDTGAILPEGADAVVKIEDVKIDGDYIIIPEKISFGRNVAWIGSDIPRGFEAVKKGDRLTPEKIALLASIGVDKVKVYVLPKVYIVITGDELIPPGKPLEPGKIYESNLYYLLSRLKEDGITVIGYDVVRDNKEEIEKVLEKASAQADVIITTGGTSAGEKDFVHQIVSEKGRLIVHGIKFKPGKPTLFGEFKGKTLIGLPGNIVSSIMVYDRIISKYLVPEGNKDINIPLKLLLPISADKKRFTYTPVYVVDNYAIPIPFDSHMIGSFSSADGFIGLEAGAKINEDDMAEVTIKNTNDLNAPTLIGEEDIRFYKLSVRKIFLGSYVGCKALEKGIGDVIVVSSLVCTPKEYDYIIERKILVNGEEEGKVVGYLDWIGISKLVSNPNVKLKSPSTAPNFLGKAKVYAPEGYIKGKEFASEKLYIIIRNNKRRLSSRIFEELAKFN